MSSCDEIENEESLPDMMDAEQIQEESAE